MRILLLCFSLLLSNRMNMSEIMGRVKAVHCLFLLLIYIYIYVLTLAFVFRMLILRMFDVFLGDVFGVMSLISSFQYVVIRILRNCCGCAFFRYIRNISLERYLNVDIFWYSQLDVVRDSVAVRVLWSAGSDFVHTTLKYGAIGYVCRCKNHR